MKLEGKVGIITGGAAGIGKGMALAMAKEGAHITIVDVDEAAGEDTLEEINEFTEGHLIVKDISNPENVDAIVSEVVDKFERLDILVNNAHVSNQKPFIETTLEDLDLSFGTGFQPTFNFMQAAYPELKKAEGKVINFASGAGINGQETQAAYAAAKEAIRGLTRVVANEWGVDGINVNIISPLAMTPGVEEWSKSAPEQYEGILQTIPMRHLGDSEEDIGRAAVFLASEDSDFITGQTLMVDGGTTKIY